MVRNLLYDRLAPLYVIIAASLWGVDSIVLRPSLYSLPVPLVVFIESAIVAIILSPIFIRQRKTIQAIEKRGLLAFIGVAVFGGAIGTMAITKALFYVDYVNLSIVVLIQKLQPVFALVLARLLLKETLPKSFFLWSSLALSGTYLMTFGFKFPNLNTGEFTVLASLFALLAAFSFGFSTVLSKRALRDVTYALGTYLRFLITTIIMLLIIVSVNQLGNISDITAHQWTIFGIIALTSGGAAIFLYYFGLKRITASVATICELSFPLTAIILEYFLRGNILTWPQWIGASLLIYSIIRVTKLGGS